MTRSVKGRSWSGPGPGARLRSWPRRPRSRDCSAAIQSPASPAMSLPRRRGCRPVKIRLLKAVRAHPDDTSRSFRAAAHVRGTDTPQSPATPQKPYRAPSRYPSHRELDAARVMLGLDVVTEWMATDGDRVGDLSGSNGIWLTPGSPYANDEAAYEAVRWAREKDVPFLGTC